MEYVDSESSVPQVCILSFRYYSFVAPMGTTKDLVLSIRHRDLKTYCTLDGSDRGLQQHIDNTTYRHQPVQVFRPTRVDKACDI